MTEKIKNVLIDSPGMKRTLMRLAYEIVERNKGLTGLVLIGVRTRGVPLAQRLASYIKDIGNQEVPVGTLDISFYRDDILLARKTPIVQSTNIPFDLTDANVVLVDDVLFTGRTARSAIDAILDHGRPAKIMFAVLIDRGHHEMPIVGDFVGKTIITSPGEEVRVRVTEIDGIDEVDVVEQS